MPGPKPPEVPVTEQERQELAALIRARKTEQRLALRARIILALAEGQNAPAVARALGTTRTSVRLWRSLHQEATVARPDGEVKMDGLMLFTLFVGVIAFTLLYAWLVIHRQRTMAAEDALDDTGLELAIAARRAETEAV